MTFRPRCFSSTCTRSWRCKSLQVLRCNFKNLFYPLHCCMNSFFPVILFFTRVMLSTTFPHLRWVHALTSQFEDLVQPPCSLRSWQHPKSVRQQSEEGEREGRTDGRSLIQSLLLMHPGEWTNERRNEMLLLTGSPPPEHLDWSMRLRCRDLYVFPLYLSPSH